MINSDVKCLSIHQLKIRKSIRLRPPKTSESNKPKFTLTYQISRIDGPNSGPCLVLFPPLHITNERKTFLCANLRISINKNTLFDLHPYFGSTTLDPGLHPAAAASRAAASVRLLSRGLAAVGVSAHATGTSAAPLCAATTAPECVVLWPPAGSGGTARRTLCCVHCLKRDVHRT